MPNQPLRGDETDLYTRYAAKVRGVVRARTYGPDADRRRGLQPRLGEAADQPARPRHRPELAVHRRHPRGLAARRPRPPRHRARRPTPESAELLAGPDPIDLDTRLEARRALTAVAGLPRRQRECVALQVGGRSYHEIAAHTGRTYTNVNKHLTRGHANLRVVAAA